jgi:secreted trypsin-like serine protease
MKRAWLAMALPLVCLASLGTASPGWSAGAADREPRIVHGTATTTSEHPWQAELVIAGQYLCGGELISPLVVLTAAHCLAEAATAGDVEVFLGRDRTFRGGVSQRAAAMATSPSFRKATLRGDWGYVVLPAPAPSQFVPLQIAGADERSLWATGTRATVTGYGTVSEHGPVSRTLREVALPILDDDACGRAAAYGGGFDPHTMLCAGDPAAGKDSCAGDSGGPLVVTADDGTPRLAGIVSFGKGCAERGFPGVYTRIAEPRLTAALLASLQAQPATASYQYVGTGGACTSATRAALRSDRALRHAQRDVRSARHRLTRARAALRQALRASHGVAQARRHLADAKRTATAAHQSLHRARTAARHAHRAAARACP